MNELQRKFLREAIDYIACRYETFTGLDKRTGKQFNPSLYVKGYTLLGMLDHEYEMKALIGEMNDLLHNHHTTGTPEPS